MIPGLEALTIPTLRRTASACAKGFPHDLALSLGGGALARRILAGVCSLVGATALITASAGAVIAPQGSV